jgi:hypothetical protein
MHRTLALLGLAAGVTLLSGCLPKPKQAYSNEQITQIASLEEIMRVQASTMDPLFGKRGQSAFTDEEFASMAEAGRRIQASSATVRDKFAANRKPSFATFAGQLNGQAGDLLAAAEAKDAAKSAATLGAMRDTCRGCHKENR